MATARDADDAKYDTAGGWFWVSESYGLECLVLTYLWVFVVAGPSLSSWGVSRQLCRIECFLRPQALTYYSTF